MRQQAVIIVAGGTGSRMQSELPKQFIKVNGKEILLHTIDRFLQFDPQIRIIISVHNDYLEFANTLLTEHHIKNFRLTAGGDTRFQSVKNGLQLIEDADTVVGIHDAARPLVSLKTISGCYNTAAQKGNATPAIKIAETIREVTSESNKPANRDHFKVIQTPQCFVASKIKKAFEQPYSANFTDDASVLEAAGEKIVLVEGNLENIKITNPHDLIIAKALLQHEQR